MNNTEPLPNSDQGNLDNQNTTAEVTPTRHPARVGTIVWGAVVLVLGILIIVMNQTGLDLDAGQTAMWLLLGAGVSMVAGGAVKLLGKKQQ